MRKYLAKSSYSMLLPRWVIAVLACCLSVITTQGLACSYPNDPDIAAQQTQCLTEKSMRWDCERNRCIHNPGDPQTAEQAEFEACANIVDPAGRKACHDEYANQKTGVTTPESKNSKMPLMVNGAFAAISAINMVGAKGGGGGVTSCASRTLFAATAAGGTLQAVMFKDETKSKLEKLRDQHEQEVATGQPYQDQLKAFEYLKQEQNIVKNAAKQKKSQYNMLTMGYAGSGAMAAAETFGVMGMKPCVGSGPVAMLGSSKAIMVMSLVGAGLSKKLADAAKKQSKEAEENIKKIDEMIAQFKQNISAECSGQRDNMALPQCYCFTVDNRPHSERKTEDMCKNFFLSDDGQTAFVAGSDYSNQPFVGKKVCMSSSTQVDRECACKKQTNPTTGENSCLKFPATLAFSGLGNALGASSMIKTANGLTGASAYPPGSLNAATLAKGAARNLKIFDKLLAKENKNRAKKNLSPIAYSDTMAEQVTSKFLSPASMALAQGSSLGGLMAASRSGNSALSPYLKKAESDANLSYSKLKLEGSSKGLLGPDNKKSSGSAGFGFNSDKNSGGGNGDILDFMDKEYKYKNDDIVERDDVSLWKIISTRYNQSALPRLFED